ncbi:MAG: ankyrin repeat domain-containing protein [Capsulimonadales bacterium]|nr:ankyrin repeat domain-containing protein [Capsulimonadales bacterium]
MSIRFVRRIAFASLLFIAMVVPAFADLPPLHSAARDGRIDDVRRLVAENPSGIDERDEDGNGALHWAVSTGQTVVTEYLLEYGANPDLAKSAVAARNGQSGWTPLHQAAAGGWNDCLRILLRHRPDLLARDQNDQTPLHTAVWHHRTDTARLLIDAGTPVNVPRRDKVIPLEIASFFGYADTVRMLLARGADPNWHVYEGYTPLHQAIRNGHIEVMRLLVEAGADIEGKKDDGQTSLHVAAAAGRVHETRFLLTMGADPEARSADGSTPLERARRTGKVGTAAVLDTFLKARRELAILREARASNRRGLPAPNIVRERTVYRNDFPDEIVGGEWTANEGTEFRGGLMTTEIPRTGKRFLGEFGNRTVRLSLRRLPPHRQVTVVLTLLVVNTWDGGGIVDGTGPDLWEANVERGPMLLRTTFANPPSEWARTPLQAFPGEYTEGGHRGGEGALRRNFLHIGSEANDPAGKPDAAYRLKFTFAHQQPTLVLNFLARGLEDIANESWGIRDIEVRIDQPVKRSSEGPKR